MTAELREHPDRLRRFVRSRVDAEVFTGLALTVALARRHRRRRSWSTALAVLVRHSEALADLDSFAANGAHHHVGPVTRRILEDISLSGLDPGRDPDRRGRRRDRMDPRAQPVDRGVPLGGDDRRLAGHQHRSKRIVDRARPTIEPVAATLGPSFPSGHSSTAAAFFAALALLAGRRRSAETRAVLAGVAVGLAVAVAVQPRAARSALGFRRGRGACARLGLVRGLCDRVWRMAASPGRSGRGGGSGGRGRLSARARRPALGCEAAPARRPPRPARPDRS